MLSTLSLIAAVNAAEPLPLPESNQGKYEEVTAFLEASAEKAKELMTRGLPLINRSEWEYDSLDRFNVSNVIPPQSVFPGHLTNGRRVYYPVGDPSGLNFKTVEYRSPGLAPYRSPVHYDKLRSFQQAGDDWSYCYGGIARYGNPGKTYDVETIEVEEIRARMKGEHTDPNESHAHPVESNCITVRVSKLSTDPFRPVGKKADQIRAQYGEFAGLPYRDQSRFFEYKLADEKVLRSSDKCERLGGYDGFTFQNNDAKAVWVKPELEMKEDWEGMARDLCDFMAQYQTPPEK